MDTVILVPAKNLEDCMIQFLCKNEVITHDDIETLATQVSTKFVPEEMTMAEIITNIRNKLIED